MSDDFDPDAYLQSKGIAQQDDAFDPDAYLKSKGITQQDDDFDPDAYLHSKGIKPQAEGELGTAARAAAHSAIPGAAAAVLGGMASGAITGSEWGTAAGPWGTAAGLAAGAVVGGVAAYVTNKAQHAAQDALGIPDDAQMAVDIEENPKSALVGELGGAFATMRPDRAASAATRLIGAGIGGAMEAGSEAANGEKIDPLKIAANAGAGAVFTAPNTVGQRLEATAGRVASRIAGRPGKTANPDGAAAKDEAQSSQQRVDVGEAAFEQPPTNEMADDGTKPAATIDTTRSDRHYPKDTAPAATTAPDILTQGQVSPDISDALNAFSNHTPGVEPANPKTDIDASLTEAPIKTGIPTQPPVQNTAAPEPRIETGIPLRNQSSNSVPGAPDTTSGPTSPQVNPPRAAEPNSAPAAQQLRAPPELSGANSEVGPAAQADPNLAGKQQLHPDTNEEGPGVGTFREIMAAVPPDEEAPNMTPRGGAPTQEELHGGNETIANELPSFHDKVVAEREKVAPNEAISPAQSEAGNYQKGHPGRIWKRQFSMETPRGGVREDKKGGKWRVENFPADYGELLGTKGADGDRLDVIHVGTGDKHYVIDQRNPETGKFDEHKIMHATSGEADALDHYNRMFNDGSGPDRVGAITPITDAEGEAWVNQKGAKKTAYGDFKEGTPAPGKALVPAAEEGPKVVTAAVTKMRENGVSEADIAAYKALPVGQQLQAGNHYLRGGKGTAVVARPNRIRTQAPVVEGITNNEGGPVTAKDLPSAKAKSADVKVMNDAYDQLFSPEDRQALSPPGKDIDTAQREYLTDKLKQFLTATDKVVYRPNFKHEPYLLQRAANELLRTKGKWKQNPSDDAWKKFGNTVRLLRGGAADVVRNENRIEADIALSKRPSVEDAEALGVHTGRNDVEDAMIEALDRAKRGEFKGDIPHEEVEYMGAADTVHATPEQIEKIEGAKPGPDITTKKGQAELQKLIDNLPRSKEKSAPVGSTKGSVALEGGSTPEAPKASAGRRIDPKDFDHNALLAQLEKATKKGALDAAESKASKAAAKEEAARPKSAEEQADELLGMTRDKNPTIRGLGEAFLRDEGGALNSAKIISDLKKGAQALVNKLALKRRFGRLVDFTHEVHESYRARVARDQGERAFNKLADRFVQMQNGDRVHQMQLRDWANSLPKELNDPAVLRRMYQNHERGTIGHLNGREQAMYNQHLKPMFDTNDQVFSQLSAAYPFLNLGPKVQNHIYRMMKGDRDIFNPADDDAISGERAISTRARGTMLQRKFFAFEQANGNRFVASHNDDGFTIWHNGKPIKVADPSFKYEPGADYYVGNRKFTQVEAMTPEIEQHARGPGGEKIEYHQNAALAAAMENHQLGSILRHNQFIEDLKTDPTLTPYMAKPFTNDVPKHWVETQLDNFKGWRMDPHLARVFNDYVQPGVNHPAINWLRNLSQQVVKTIFWNPVPHTMNTGVHWFGSRGYRWLPFTGGYKTLANTALEAIKSVVNQDDYQKQLLERGASLMLPRVFSRDFAANLAKGFGEAVKLQPSKWDPIARQFGIGPSDLARAVYRWSNRAMWSANDVLYTQLHKEFVKEGMSFDQAITAVERHLPNYRIPAAIMGTGMGARVFSQILSEPAFTLFGRYHFGIFNSYANIAKDLVQGNGRSKLDAIGNLFAQGLLAYAVYPVLDNAYRWLTGNDKASAQRRGSLTIPNHVARAAQGKEEPTSILSATFPVSPLLTMPMEIWRNRDFSDKPIIERGAFQKAAQGNAREAGKVAVQGGKYLARQLVSPYNTAMQAVDKGENLGGTLRDQLLDIKNPGPKARKYDAQSTMYNQRHELQRDRHGSTEEKLYNRMTR